MSCCATCSKTTVVALNAMLAFGAIVGFIAFHAGYLPSRGGVIFYVSLFIQSTAYKLFLTVIIFVILGSLFSSLYCCCGDKKGFRIFYLTYFTLIVIAEICVAIFVLKNNDQFYNTIREAWNSYEFREYRKEFEREFRCCGFDEFDPVDCGCSFIPNIECLRSCFTYITDDVENKLGFVCVFLIVVAVFQVALIILMSYLTCCDKSIKQQQEYTSI